MMFPKYIGKNFFSWASRIVYLVIFSVFLLAVIRQLWGQPSFSFKGEINSTSIKPLMSKNIKHATILVNSEGGETAASAVLGQYLFENSVTVVIDKECTSGCVEFILPAAEKIVFQNDPIIAYHWGPMLSEYQMIAYGGDTQNCDNEIFHIQESLFEARNLNKEFWREAEKRLELIRFKVVDKGEKCPWKIRKFSNDFWLPTSKQLRDLLGLQFTGSVCADDFRKCTSKINHTYKKGSRIIVGNDLHVSKGRNKM